VQKEFFGIFIDNCFGEVGEQVLQLANLVVKLLDALILQRR